MDYRHVLDDILTEEQIIKLEGFNAPSDKGVETDSMLQKLLNKINWEIKGTLLHGDEKELELCYKIFSEAFYKFTDELNSHLVTRNLK